MATFDSIQTGNIHIDQGDRTEKNLSPLVDMYISGLNRV